jgi:hypothetical protein
VLGEAQLTITVLSEGSGLKVAAVSNNYHKLQLAKGVAEAAV